MYPYFTLGIMALFLLNLLFFNVKLALVSIGIAVVLFFIKEQKERNMLRRIKKLEASYRHFTYVNQITEALRSTMKLDNLMSIILNNLTHDLKFDRAILWTIDETYHRRVLRCRASYGVRTENYEWKIRPFDKNRSIVARCALSKKAFLIRNAPTNPFCEKTLVRILLLKEFALVPIIMKERPMGVLLVDNIYTKKPITEANIEALNIFCNQVGIAIENATLYEKIEDLSIRDGLTGAFNHRYFQEALRKEIRKAQQEKSFLSLALLDIDNFKKYNDNYGHLVGDELLKKIVETIELSLKEHYLLARYGGEEFVIIFPKTTTEESFKISEEIRKSIEAMSFSPGRNVTISVGIATYPIHGRDAGSLIEFADKGLYLAKSRGKNKVCIYGKA